ncbi:MAG TPA: hypothetical protein VHC97_13530 [Thermoanaerobaculia bacterium]|jgi:hypothetical protein|nr:hypothetical protein [Thermoanaerobaculia bacterium]
METTQEVVTQEPLVAATVPGESKAGDSTGLRRPPRPSGELLTGEASVESRLKSERVEEMLRQMPGWKLLPGGRAVDRVREMATPEIAADYAAWVLRSAARLGRCVGVRLAGSRCLTITLEGRGGSRRRSLSEADLNFAKSLG